LRSVYLNCDMLRIKRLYTFVLGSFLPLLLATFSVCLFILLMQFVFMFINDMVGKGVGLDVMAQLFFYASINLVPKALPLAILLASLMAFGNLGEHFELLAMKASGISLLRIMRPLIWFVVGLAALSLFMQSEISPHAQKKMNTILLSLRNKSPELAIPEGSFYKEIPGYNIYVRHKDRKTGMLRDLMIYNYSSGFENAVVIVADSGKINMSDDKQHLVLTLYHGESFENMNTVKTRKVNDAIPYRRETFALRTNLIAFDANFALEDESMMSNRDWNKKLRDLSAFIDSARIQLDSVNNQQINYFKTNVYAETFTEKRPAYQTFKQTKSAVDPHVDSLLNLGFEAFFDQLPLDRQIQYFRQAKTRVEQLQSNFNFTSAQQTGNRKELLSHIAELYHRFAIALSCILFFFIGAPLGAIIRKGGLGLPAVLSVVLYILYYIIDTLGIKVVKQDVWQVWQGVCLSTVILTLIGVFCTYQALNDSAMLNPEDWKIAMQNLWKKINRRQKKSDDHDPQ